jgi:hypothetical protein
MANTQDIPDTYFEYAGIPIALIVKAGRLNKD